MLRRDRRAFVSLCTSLGLGSTLLPGVLWAQMQPGTKAVTLDMVRESATLAGIDWTDAECQELVASLSSLARGAEGIDKATLTNASPLPIHFNPRPTGRSTPVVSASVFQTQPAPPVARPRQLETVAFWPVTHLAHLIKTRQVRSTELTRCISIG